MRPRLQAVELHRRGDSGNVSIDYESRRACGHFYFSYEVIQLQLQLSRIANLL